MNRGMNFRFQDAIVTVCALLMLSAVILPAWTGSAGTSRTAVCMNNMKLIGVGLELWRENAGRYPGVDYAHTPLCSNPDLGPWCDVLALTEPIFGRQNLEANRDWLEAHGYPLDFFIRTVDHTKVFRCPADHPHPHWVNEERARAWNFWRADDEDGYQYSYSISVASVTEQPHPREDSQILSADGLWTWSRNLSGIWVTDPSAGWNCPYWFSNTVGYRHREGGANFLLRDIHVETHRYPPDTNEIFFSEPGESLNAFY
jgi:hypothetical protein